jgi:hypothetical protein
MDSVYISVSSTSLINYSKLNNMCNSGLRICTRSVHLSLCRLVPILLSTHHVTGRILLRRLRSTLSTRRLLFTLALAAPIAAFGLWQYWPNDSSTKVTPGQALGEFRRLTQQDPRRGRPTTGLPSPGVYRYAINGGESLSSFLSADHRYDGIATISVSASACGIEERWEVLRERWTASRMCRGDGGMLQLTQIREHHEFFGSVENLRYACEPAAAEDATYCSSSGGSILYTTRSLGSKPVEIAGQLVAADHFRARATFSGDSSGEGQIDEWRRASDGLLLRKKLTVKAHVASVGAEYGERYQLHLLATRPDR